MILPISFSELASPVSQVVYVPGPHDPLRTMPFVAAMPPHPIFFPPQDFQLHAKLVAQIDYYFRYFVVVPSFFYHYLILFYFMTGNLNNYCTSCFHIAVMRI